MKKPLTAPKKAIFRALDANCNRVREGLRVAEDTARFLMNDKILTVRLKNLRHRVTKAELSLMRSSRLPVSARDVKGDLGRGNQEKSESSRLTVASLMTANLKRVQEGLRSLEEFSKLIRHPSAIEFKNLRYSCYQIEESLFN